MLFFFKRRKIKTYREVEGFFLKIIKEAQANWQQAKGCG
jgi:hypothetical protein